MPGKHLLITSRQLACRNRGRILTHRVCLLLAALLSLSACALAPYRFVPLEQTSFRDNVAEQRQGDLAVRAAVPSFKEAEALFGIDLRDRGIQPVWLEVSNGGDHRARLAPYSLDREYFTPHEVAYMYRKRFSKQGWKEMEQRFYEMSMPRQIQPGQVASGFVFTRVQRGTKAFNVDLFYVQDRVPNAHFTFFVDVPDFTPDHQKIDFKALYSADRVKVVNERELRQLIAQSPCCTTDRSGERQGRPVEIFFVATGGDLLQALLRGGWEETEYQRDRAYLDTAEYLFERPADAILRHRRDRKRDRNELLLWLTPWKLGDTTVWAAQARSAVGRYTRVGERFLGTPLDPDSSESRNFLLQNVWYAQSLAAYAWSNSGIRIPLDEPLTDFNGYPFYADGFRFVLWVQAGTVALQNAVDRGWDTIQKGER